MKKQASKFSEIRDLLLQNAEKIQKLASQQHKYLLGAKNLRNEYLDKYIHAHILIVKELANNLGRENLKRGTETFKKIGRNLAKQSLKDGLTLEEAVDGTIFLKQAIWQKLKEQGLLNLLGVEDFYEFSFMIGTYCDILVSVITFVYHRNYIKTLEEQDRHKDEFMSIATHELKTPVTSLKIFAQVLENRFAKAGDQTSALHLAKMDAQLNKLTALIEDLLDATKINSGKLQFHEEFFDINELVDEIVEEMQRTTEKHTLIKKLGVSKIIYGDRTRIGQVLVNLLSNAIKYSPKKDKIIIMTKVDKKSVTISVQDFGIGIATEDQVKIFKRFQRVGNQNTFGGLGLGLFIAATIVKRHGGGIEVASEQGKGSVLSFTLPLKRRNVKQQKNTIVKEDLDHE